MTSLLVFFSVSGAGQMVQPRIEISEGWLSLGDVVSGTVMLPDSVMLG